MALAINSTGANGAVLSRDQENKLLDELFALQLAIVEGKKPQYRVSAATLKQLQATVASAPTHTGIVKAVASAPHSIPGPAHGTTPAAVSSSSGLNPIFLEKSDHLIRAEGRLKRQRIERELYDQVEQRRRYIGGERDGQISVLDVDNVLARAQTLVPPVSGLKAAVVVTTAAPAPADDKSSFDENDYYSSQVESDWSATGVPVNAEPRLSNAFTADFEHFDEAPSGRPAKKLRRNSVKANDHVPAPAYASNGGGVPVAQQEADDEYEPQEPVAGYDDTHPRLEHISPPNGEEASDYEPGEVSQASDEYTPEYAPAPVASPQHTRVAHNNLTQIAAPQPNRVSPLAVHKTQPYELELVNGRPEVVHKPRSRYDTDHNRQSSASPPANLSGRAGKRSKPKKRKREIEQAAKSKKRERRAGLDMSAQYPPVSIKPEPNSPMPRPTLLQPSNYRVVEQPPPPQFAPSAQYYAPPAMPPPPQRASSVMAHHVVPRGEQDLRRIATLHNASLGPAVGGPMSPVAPYAAMGRAQPTEYRQAAMQVVDNMMASFDAAQMPPPPMPKRVVVDQYGNRYYAAEPEPAPMQASVAPESQLPQFNQAPSRSSTAQYDPANPRFEFLQPPMRTAATPAYALDADDGRMQKIRSHAPQAMASRQYTVEPTLPVYEQPVQYEQPYGQQTVMTQQNHHGMPPPAYQFVDPGRQTMAPPPQQVYSQDGFQYMQAPARAYSVQPEYLQQMPMAMPPRQGSVAPVQYIRQSVQPEPSVRYVDARGYEVPPSQVRQVQGEYRQY